MAAFDELLRISDIGGKIDIKWCAIFDLGEDVPDDPNVNLICSPVFCSYSATRSLNAKFKSEAAATFNSVPHARSA